MIYFFAKKNNNNSNNKLRGFIATERKTFDNLFHYVGENI